MTLGQALYQFFNSFGIDAYPITAVPDDIVMPYLSYEYSEGMFGDAEISATVNLWDYSFSEQDITEKASEITERIGRGGVIIHYDGGAVWLKRGDPWLQSVASDDVLLKHKYFNLVYEFI